MLVESLVKIGLTQAESLVYLELFRLGSQPVSTLAKRLKLNRTTVYSVLKKLMQKGLVGDYTNKGVKYFLANDPNCLITYLDRRCRTLDYYRNQFVTLIPKFRNESSVVDVERPEVSYFDGLTGVKHLLSDFFAGDSAVCSVCNVESWKDNDLDNYILDELRERASCSDYLDLSVVFDTPFNRDFAFTFLKSVNFRFCSRPDVFMREMYICDDKVAYFNFEKRSQYGILIKSRPVALMQRCIFDNLYSSISEDHD